MVAVPSLLRPSTPVVVVAGAHEGGDTDYGTEAAESGYELKSPSSLPFCSLCAMSCSKLRNGSQSTKLERSSIQVSLESRPEMWEASNLNIPPLELTSSHDFRGSAPRSPIAATPNDTDGALSGL